MIVLQLVQADGRSVVFSASAPAKLYDEYEPLFNDLATDIRVVPWSG